MKSTPDFSKYKYDSTDLSILLPWLEGYVNLFLRWIPRAVPANFVSIVSCLFLWLAFAINLFWKDRLDFSILVLINVLLVHAYLVGDLLDGRQARRTSTSTPLGTYMDHSLDAVNTCLMMSINITLFSVDEIWMQVLMLFFASSAFLFAQVEENITHKIFLDRFGNVEALFLIKIVYLLLLIPSFRDFFDRADLFELKNYFWLVAFLGVSAFFTAVGSIRRMKDFPKSLAVFLGFFAAFGYALVLHESNVLWVWLVLSALVAEQAAEVVFANIGRMPLPRFSFLKQSVILLYLSVHGFPFIFSEIAPYIKLPIYLYIILSFIIATAFRMYQMRSMWIWKNPTSNPLT